LLVINNNNILP